MFSKGGSNLLWNLFQSHPDIVSPIAQTNELLKGLRGRIATALSTGQARSWSAANLRPTSRAHRVYLRYFDRSLARMRPWERTFEVLARYTRESLGTPAQADG